MDEIEHPIPIYVEALNARFWVLLKAGWWGRWREKDNTSFTMIPYE
jgi:hypothetical protein